MDPGEAAAKARWRRAPVLIVGAHRSGTTATARALETLGLQIGQQLDSHHESKALQRLHEHYLQRLGAAWHNPTPFLHWVQTPEGERDCLEYLGNGLRQHFAGLLAYGHDPRGLWLRTRLKFGAPWGWKEPRTTLFAPFWLQLFPGARFIDVVRHPVAVAMSIRQREREFRAAGDSPTPQLDDLDYCLRLALIYVELGEQLSNRTPRYRRVRFEELQANPAGVLQELADFCDLRPTRPRLARAASSIRPAGSRQSQGVSGETMRELISRHPGVGKLGYGLD